jgi:hypothetical protein
MISMIIVLENGLIKSCHNMSIYKLKFDLVTIQILLLILASGGVLHIFGGSILTFFFIVFLIILFYNARSVKLRKKILSEFILSEIFFLLLLSFNFFSVIYHNESFVYISLFFRLSLVNIFVLYLVNYRINFLNYLYKALSIVLLLSILNFLLGFFIIPYSVETVNKVIVKTVFFVFNYQSEVEFMGIHFYRNQSVFWEPGILSIFMNLFILISFVQKKFNTLFYLSIFILLTTFSTTGYILFASQFIYFIYSKRSNPLVSIISVLFFLIIVFIFLLPNLEEKIIGQGVASFDLRTFDLLNAFSIFKSNPFLGIGLDPSVYLKLYDKFEIIDFNFTYDVYTDFRGNSNSVLMIFVSFGIFLGSMFYYVFFNKNIFGNKSKIFYFIILVSLFSEPLILSNFFLLIPLYNFYELDLNL